MASIEIGSSFVLTMALNLMNMFMLVNSQCYYAQEMLLGQTFYIHNKEYPKPYVPNTNCRWSARSLPGTQIVLSCDEIDIPETINCVFDRLSVSLSGDPYLRDARNFCSKGSLSLVSNENRMEIALVSTYFSRGGSFVCSITAIMDDKPTTTTRRPINCDCGWKNGLKIVGGLETGVNEFPFMAAIVDFHNYQLFCGASIISERYALTAAHCLVEKTAEDVGLLVGDHNISSGQDTKWAKVYRSEQLKIHQKYNIITQENDIALVKTQFTINFSLYVGPVCLPFRYTNLNFGNVPVTALGWGSEEFSGPKSSVLQEVKLNIITNDQCRATEKNISSQQICTFSPGKDVCQSDSGGPLIWTLSDVRRMQLLGVISYGLGCATSRPTVSTRITSYLSWIISHTEDTNYCVK